MSKLSQLEPPSISWNLHDCVFQFAPFWLTTESPNSLDRNVPVYSHTHSIMTSDWISMFTQPLCGERVDLESRLPMSESSPHIAWHRNEISETEWFLLKNHWNTISGSEEIPGYDEPHILCGSMNTWQECIRIHMNSVDLQKLSQSVWNKELGKIKCALHIMRWCLSTPRSPRYIMPVAESISVIPVSPEDYI